jgi:hypothetical protein
LDGGNDMKHAHNITPYPLDRYDVCVEQKCK